MEFNNSQVFSPLFLAAWKEITTWKFHWCIPTFFELLDEVSELLGG
jgi:hypothetical protein